MNDLLLTEAFTGGVPLDHLDTQIRANVGDGGVDASVAVPVPNSKSGWFAVPTCWQYKAGAYTTTKSLITEIGREMKKPYAAQKIKMGHGYRFCMIESVPEGTVVTEIEVAMLETAKDICSGSGQLPAAPRLVHGGALSSWARMYPAVVIRMQGRTGDFQLFSPWLQNQRQITPTYVENPAWSSIASQIRLHVNFANPPFANDICLLISGNSGVGKTRLVAETLNTVSGAVALVIQTDVADEALRIASYLTQDRSRHAILVVDECTPRTAYDLQQRLRSFSDSVRVVAIEHLDRAPIVPPEELGRWLVEPGREITLKILEENFPSVSPERRRIHSVQSEGFIRFAADLCEHDAEIDIDAMTASPNSVYRYIQRRLDADRDLDIVGALSLFSKIGYREDVDGEIEMLSNVTGIPVDTFRQSIDRLRHSPGFIAQVGRYWYVTPEIVTRSVFPHGWQRFVEPNVGRFLRGLSPEHLQQFQSRANAYGGSEVARKLADYFRTEMTTLEVGDLADSRVAQFVVAVAETNLQQYLPVLADLICESTDVELADLEQSVRSTSWSSRRYLIWFLEKAASFEEFFLQAERALFRLAQFETEPEIGNNATAIWAQLFRLRLSGTAAGYLDRLEILRKHFSARDHLGLLARALNEALGRPGVKAAPPPFFAGHRTPAAWRPESLTEERSCLEKTLQMCGELLREDNEEVGGLVFESVFMSIDWLVRRGVGDIVQESLPRESLSELQQRRIYNKLNEFLRIDFAGRENCTGTSDDVLEMLNRWADELAPKSFSQRLRALVSLDPWDESFRPELGGEFGPLSQYAEAMIAEPSLLVDEFDWLASDEALSTRRLGHVLGALDSSDALAIRICQHAQERRQAKLLAGYLSGIVERSGEVPTVVDETVGFFCQHEPVVALDLLQVGGVSVRAVERLCDLIASGKIAPCQAVGFGHHVGRSRLSIEQFESLLELFVAQANADVTQQQCVVRFASLFRQAFNYTSADQDLFSSARLLDRVIAVLDLSKEGISSRAISEWTGLAKAVAKQGREEVFSMLRETLLSKDITVTQKTLDVLAELAEDHPTEVMAAFGGAVLDERGIFLRAHVCNELIAAVDGEVVLTWLESAGERAAELLARHLPHPFLDEAGRFQVPDLLDRVLIRFGSDRVIAALHAGINSSQTYWGNLSPILLERASHYQQLLQHQNPAIRRLAREEVEYLSRWAEREKQREEESVIGERAND